VVFGLIEDEEAPAVWRMRALSVRLHASGEAKRKAELGIAQEYEWRADALECLKSSREAAEHLEDSTGRSTFSEAQRGGGNETAR
jgi:hypothetical protein